MDVNASMNVADLIGEVWNETTPVISLRQMIGKRSTLLGAITITIGITGVLGNSLVVLVVYKYKTLFQQVKSSYIINQSFIDGLTSGYILLAQIFTVGLTEGMTQLHAEFFCRLWATQLLPWGLMVSSTYNLMAISVERYMAIVHPIWHMSNFTDSKTRFSIVIIWFFGVLYVGAIVIPTSGLVNGECLRAAFWPSRAIAAAVGIMELFVTLMIPFITHGFCYARILTTLRNRCPHEESSVTPSSTDVNMTTTSTDTDMSTAQEPSNAEQGITLEVGTHKLMTFDVGRKEIVTRKENGSGERASNKHLQTVSGSSNARGRTTTTTAKMSLAADNQEDARQKQTKKAEKNVIKTLTIITVCFFICWIPNKIHISLILAGVTKYVGDIFQVTTIFVFGNCCINPLIYIAKYDAFKTGLRALFRRE